MPLQSQTAGQPAVATLPAERLDYAPQPGLLDEAHGADGQLKPGWQYLLESVADLGPEVLRKREEKARRILRDDGATYNIYGRPGSPSV